MLKETQDDYKKMVKTLDEFERNENELKVKLNQAIIEKNKAISETESLKKQGAIFKNEYNTMESQLAVITQQLAEKNKLVAALEVCSSMFFIGPINRVYFRKMSTRELRNSSASLTTRTS